MNTNYYVDTMNVYYKEQNKHMKRFKGLVESITTKLQDYEKIAHKYLNERAYSK